jgi:hypothetical protein
MTIRDELLDLRDDDGMLFPASVVEWAETHPDSSLHNALEWDNDRAANAWRLEQVRQLIRLYITVGEPNETVVSLSIDRTNGGGYRSMSDVAARPDLRDIMLADALAELQRVQAKYQRVQELEAVWREAEAVRTKTPKRGGRRAAQPESVAAA